MNFQKEFDELSKKYNESVESLKKRIREKLMSMSKEERFRCLREDMSLKGIESMCEWALPDEDYEICASVEEVKANNIDKFKIRFTYQNEVNNKASVVKFIGTDKKTYYHADFLLNDNEEGSVIMLHKNNQGIWTSESKSNDTNMFIPIGRAIDNRDNLNKNPT